MPFPKVSLVHMQPGKCWIVDLERLNVSIDLKHEFAIIAINEPIDTEHSSVSKKDA